MQQKPAIDDHFQREKVDGGSISTGTSGTTKKVETPVAMATSRGQPPTYEGGRGIRD